MNKETITSQRTGDSCIHIKHDSGLDIYICEMQGFSGIEALIGTKYGSVNTMFKIAADSDYTTVPEGIAHFLEHKLFENEDCGVFELYAGTGAMCNAFTSFDKTCYLFSCSKNYEENLKILLEFVQKPYFTKENVDKEMGIIGQEIQMTNDNPEWRVFFNMLRCMYHAHPVKTDIAGTVESISKIDAPLLYKCYDTFYNLNNMVLSIAGNISYLFMFCGLWYFFCNPEKSKWKTGEFWKKGFILVGKLLAVSVCGYFASLILWPYALKNPISHPIESLQMMEHFATNLRQIFEGGNIFSSDAPWYYLPKYMFISIPIVVLIGFIASVILTPKMWKNISPLVLFIVFFSAIFPIAYIIYKHSNVYGGWRHVLFTYPFIVVAAGFGWETIYEWIKNKYFQYGLYAITAVLLALPMAHIIKNHPHEYVYYNEFAGGVGKNYGFYEMDYYQHSTRAASKWLINHLKENGEIDKAISSKNHIIVASNDGSSLQYYLRKDTNALRSTYIRYYERGSKMWDYAIVINSYINAYQLQKGIWPPNNTIHTIDVDGKPIAAILKRTDLSDFEAGELMGSLNDTALTNDEKITNLQNAITLYRKALSIDPHNETALTGIVGAYNSTRRMDSVLYYTDKLIEACPSENFLSYAANIYISAYQQTRNQQYLDKVISLRKEVIKSNPRAANAYYELAMLYAQIGQQPKGKKCMENCIKKNGGSFSAHYYSAIFTAQTGNPSAGMEELRKCAKKFPSHKEECENTIAQIQGRR